MASKIEKFTLKNLAQMFVDFDRISSQEWDEKYGKRAAILSKHFQMKSGDFVLDTLREAMEVVLVSGTPIVLYVM